MSEIKAKIVVDKLEAKVKMVEEKEDGMVMDRHLINRSKDSVRRHTGPRLERILWALQAGHTVSVTFDTPQQGARYRKRKRKRDSRS